jgi:hypothetical protein
MLSMREERSWKYKVMLTKRTEILVSTLSQLMDFINNGISSMLTNGKVNQERENLTKSLASMLKDHSM